MSISWQTDKDVVYLYKVGEGNGTPYAAAAKSLQSCPTLWDPIDGSPPGSPVPGILQARTLEWVAIAFSSAWKWKVKVKLFSHVWLVGTPQTAAYQAPPSMGFSRQGVPLPFSLINYTLIMVIYPERRCPKIPLTLDGTLHWTLRELLVVTLMTQDWDPNNTRLTLSKPDPRMVAQRPPVKKQPFQMGHTAVLVDNP